MKFLLLALLITYGSCMPRDQGGAATEDDHEPIYMSKVYGKANKVPGGSRSSFGRSGNEMCSVECMRRMKQDIEGDEEFSEFIEKQSKPYRFDKQFDQRMLNKYCQKMNRTVDCVVPCTDGQIKQMASKALSLPKYMCIETRFVEYAPCYNKVAKQMESVCHANNKCGPKKTALENDMRKQPSSMQDVEKMLQHTCDYMNCFNDCDRTKVVQECGADANNVLEGLYKKSIDVMRDIFATMGVSIAMPQECNRVGSGASGRTGGFGPDSTDEGSDDDGLDVPPPPPPTSRTGGGSRRGGGTGGRTGGRGTGGSKGGKGSSSRTTTPADAEEDESDFDH